MQNKEPLFCQGSVRGTPGAVKAMAEAKANGYTLLFRHVTGDWGEMDEEDQQANRLAVEEGGRVFSTYHLSTGIKIWIITEADRSMTTFLLPEEY